MEEKQKKEDAEQLCCICFLHSSGGHFSLNQLNSQWCERWGLVRQPADSTWNGLSNSHVSENQQGTRRWCFIYGVGEAKQRQGKKALHRLITLSSDKSDKETEWQSRKQKLKQPQRREGQIFFVCLPDAQYCTFPLFNSEQSNKLVFFAFRDHKT